eukprot:13605344-Ditylum_brightwellii.AAC.1
MDLQLKLKSTWEQGPKWISSSTLYVSEVQNGPSTQLFTCLGDTPKGYTEPQESPKASHKLP